MSPSAAAGCFLWGLALGAGLGLWYGFLQPMRHRFLGDLLFLAGVFPVWLIFCFGVCRGDIRFGLLLSLPLGGILFHKTLGRLFMPLWRGFWRGISRITGGFKKFFGKTGGFLKKFLATGKKTSKIKSRNRVHPGGKPHDHKKQNRQAAAGDEA